MSRRAEAMSPETSPARLFELASEYPVEVQENPAMAVLSLEDPGLYLHIMNRAVSNELLFRVSEMSSDQRLELALRAAREVLPFWEKKNPDDGRLKRALRSVERWKKGRSARDLAELETARVDAGQAFTDAMAGTPEESATMAMMRLLALTISVSDRRFSVANQINETVGAVHAATFAYPKRLEKLLAFVALALEIRREVP